MADKIKIVGFGGSLRKGSYNYSLLKAAKELTPPDTEFEIAEITDIPLYNTDLEANMPEAVKQFKAKIKGADAIVVVTPEYDYSVPGYLKNVLDWASRPYGDNSFSDKPIAIMSGSGGILGGSRAQYQLRQVLQYLNTHPLNRPEVIVSHVHEKITPEGVLTDQITRDHIKEQLIALVAWTKKLSGK